MTQETLIFKDKKIVGDNLEIRFHRDYTYLYNEFEFPVVVFRLMKCKNLDKVDFERIDVYNDGVVIDIKKSGSSELFITTDLGGIKFTIECEKSRIRKKGI